MKTTKQMQAVISLRVNRVTLAKFLRVSPSYVDQLMREDGFPRFKQQLVVLRDAIRYMIERERTKRSRLDDETALKLQVEREIKQLKLAEMRRELVAVEEVYTELAKPFNAARMRLLALPRQLAPQVTGAATSVETESIIERYITDVLNEWSAGISGNGTGAPVVSGSQTTTKADRERVGRRAPVSKRRIKRRGRKVAHRSG